MKYWTVYRPSSLHHIPEERRKHFFVGGVSISKMSDLQALCKYNILKRIASRGNDKNSVWPSYPPTLATSLDPLNHVIPSTKVRAECVGWGVNNFDAYFPEMAYFSRYPPFTLQPLFYLFFSKTFETQLHWLKRCSSFNV